MINGKIVIIVITIVYLLFPVRHASSHLPRGGTRGHSLELHIKWVRAQPAPESHHQEGTNQVHLLSSPASPALPAPGLLGDVVDEGAPAEAQLIALLGFVVVQSFHGSLRLSGKARRRRSGG